MLNEWCGYKLNLINVINMNIEINIETLLFGIDIYTDHTKFLENVLFFIKQTKRFCTPSQQL
jgi:hypothetical protein